MTIIKPSDEFKRNFDEAAQRVAKEVHEQMVGEPVQSNLSRRQAKRLAKAKRKMDLKKKAKKGEAT